MAQEVTKILTKPSFSTVAITFDSYQLFSVYPDNNHVSPWGTSHLLLYLKILQDIQNKNISLDQEIYFSEEIRGENNELRSTDAHLGEKRLLLDVLNQAIALNAPDCIRALWQLYGGRVETKKVIQKLAIDLSISEDSLKSLTGRKTSGQMSNLEDYYKIGLEYLKLDRITFSYIHNRTHVINKKTYRPQSLLDVKGDAVASIFWGTNQNDCFIFHIYNNLLVCSLVINGRSYIHTVESAIASYLKTDGIIQNVTLESPTINILADTYFGEFYTERRKKKKIEDALLRYGYHHSFEKISKKLSEKDFNIITYEGVLVEPGEECFNKHKVYYLGGNKEETISELKSRSINLVNLGNNHAKDYGEKALIDTLSSFNENGVCTIGAGKNIQEAVKPVVIHYKEHTVAFFSGYWYRKNQDLNFDFYASSRAGVASLDGILQDQIASYRQDNPDATIAVVAHWGVDFKNIQRRQKQLAQDLLESGADLIFGSGPHKVQNIERVNHKIVFYSLGNGIFNSDGGQLLDKGNLVYGYFLKWNLELENIQVYPFWNYNPDTFWQPHFIDEIKLEKVNRDISHLDMELTQSGALLDGEKKLYYEVSISKKIANQKITEESIEPLGENSKILDLIDKTKFKESRSYSILRDYNLNDSLRQKLKISIIIPVYNREKLIVNCLDSISNQSLSKELFEVILIDDCSKDNSIEVINKYSKINNLRLISLSENSGGASKPRNIGIDLALGEYIIFIDSDDVITEKALEYALTIANKGNLDMVVIPIKFGEERKAYTPLFTEYPNGINKTLLSEDKKVRQLLFSNPGIIGRLYKTSLLKKSGIRFSEKMRTYEDTLFAKFVALASESFGMVPLNVAHYYPMPATNNENLSLLKRTIERCLLYLIEAIRMTEAISDSILNRDKKMRIVNHSFCRNNIYDVLNCPKGYKALGEYIDLLLPYLHYDDTRSKAKELILKVNQTVLMDKNINLANKYFLSDVIPQPVLQSFDRAWCWKEKILVLDFNIKENRFGIDISTHKNYGYMVHLVLRGNSKFLDINWSDYGEKRDNRVYLFSYLETEVLEFIFSRVTEIIDSLIVKINNRFL